MKDDQKVEFLLGVSVVPFSEKAVASKNVRGLTRPEHYGRLYS